MINVSNQKAKHYLSAHTVHIASPFFTLFNNKLNKAGPSNARQHFFFPPEMFTVFFAVIKTIPKL